MEISQEAGFAGSPLVDLNIGAIASRCSAFKADGVPFVFDVFGGIITRLGDEHKFKLRSQPDCIRHLVGSLISHKPVNPLSLLDAGTIAQNMFAVANVSHSLDHGDLTTRATAMAAMDIDASVLDQTRIALKSGPYGYQSIAISYAPSGVKAADALPPAEQTDIDRAAANLAEAHLPDNVREACLKLVAAGYTNAAVLAGCPTPLAALINTSGSMPHLTFRKGDRYEYVQVQVTWIL